MLEILPGGFEERVDEAGVELAGYIAPPLAPAMTVELAAWEPTVSPVAAGWDTAWQRFHQPVVIGPLWIGPPWEQVPAGMSSVTIRPGMAFGTGAHPTTRLCVELLSEQPRGPVLDLGCGSGVLAVVAAVMGFGPVTAVDTDSVAVDETLENAARNGVQLDVRKEDAQGAGPIERLRCREPSDRHPTHLPGQDPAPPSRRVRVPDARLSTDRGLSRSRASSPRRVGGSTGCARRSIAE